jgi:hypothetical protein
MNYKYFLIIVSFFLSTNLTAKNQMSYYNSKFVRNEKNYFTVQIASYPQNEIQKALELFNRCKNEYFTYITEYHHSHDCIKYYRVRIGCFEKCEDAKIFGTALKEKGYDYFIDQQIFLEASNSTIKILKVQSGIWLFQNMKYKEIYDLSPSIENNEINSYYTQPFLSTKGDIFLFEYDDKIIIKNLVNGDEKKIDTDHIYNSFPQISTSGKYIAYIKDNGWESWSGLQIITDPDSSFCLIDVKTMQGSQAVKNFRWHPEKDIIFYVMGYASGTVSVGGDIYCIDLSGKNKLLIASNKDANEEIALDISLDNQFLYYNIVKYNDQYSEIIEIRSEKILLNKLLEMFLKK